MHRISLAKAQENLFTVLNVLGECQSAGMEHSYLVHGGNITFRRFLTYIL
jgi:hypothetical protein